MRAAMTIVAGVFIYVATTVGGGASPGQRNLMPFQKLIADRPFDEQRMFRELQEGLIEAERMRSAANAWPTPSALADAGIPPFAADPTQRRTYDWRLSRNGTLVNYLGIPRDDAPAWLIVVVEPDPGVPPDQPFEDQEHHRLLNGAMLHVATWVHSNGRTIADRIVRMPQTEGWIQLYAVSASAPPASSGRP